jgi:rubrerythrin
VAGRGKARVAVWRDTVRESELTSTPKLVALVLSTYMNGDGHAYPSIGTLAAGSSLSRRAVEHSLPKLEAAGFLEIARTRGRTSHTYAITLPATANEVRRSEWTTANDLLGSTANKVRRSGKSKSEPDALNHERQSPNRVSRSHESVESVESTSGGRLNSAPPSLIEDNCLQCGSRFTGNPDDVLCPDCTQVPA